MIAFNKNLLLNNTLSTCITTSTQIDSWFDDYQLGNILHVQIPSSFPKESGSLRGIYFGETHSVPENIDANEFAPHNITTLDLYQEKEWLPLDLTSKFIPKERFKAKIKIKTIKKFSPKIEKFEDFWFED